MATTNIQCGGLDIPRKVKFQVQIGEESFQCISATHVSMLLKSRDLHLSKADVYNWCDPNRNKKRLTPRFPENVTITKC